MFSLPAVIALWPAARAVLGEAWAGLRSPWGLGILAALALAASHLYVYTAGRDGARLACRAAELQLRLDAETAALAAERAERVRLEQATTDANARALDLAETAATRATEIERYRDALAKRPAAEACRPSAADRALDRRLRGEPPAARKRP